MKNAWPGWYTHASGQPPSWPETVASPLHVLTYQAVQIHAYTDSRSYARRSVPQMQADPVAARYELHRLRPHPGLDLLRGGGRGQEVSRRRPDHRARPRQPTRDAPDDAPCNDLRLLPRVNEHGNCPVVDRVEASVLAVDECVDDGQGAREVRAGLGVVEDDSPPELGPTGAGGSGPAHIAPRSAGRRRAGRPRRGGSSSRPSRVNTRAVQAVPMSPIRASGPNVDRLGAVPAPGGSRYRYSTPTPARAATGSSSIHCGNRSRGLDQPARSVITTNTAA